VSASAGPASQLRIWWQGHVVLRAPALPHSGRVVPHPEQFHTVVPTAAARRPLVPLGHRVPAPVVEQRPLAEYDWLCGVTTMTTMNASSDEEVAS
jgi:hypothetical protein